MSDLLRILLESFALKALAGSLGRKALAGNAIFERFQEDTQERQRPQKSDHIGLRIAPKNNKHSLIEGYCLNFGQYSESVPNDQSFFRLRLKFWLFGNFRESPDIW
jgi:hypothetical protein